MSTGKRIGIMGGGQLARMMAIAGIPLGYSFCFLDPAPDACARELGTLLNAGFDDLEAAAALGQQVDLATFDFENVPESSALVLAEKATFSPGTHALGLCQDRLSEKILLSEVGIQVPPYHVVDTRTDLLQALEAIAYPAVLKTRRLGYDGKGQQVLRQPEDLERAWQKIGGQALILEAFVPFDAECSLVAVRDGGGDFRFWPLTRNVHENGILLVSRPATFESELQVQAERHLRQLADHLDYVGVLTVEFFVSGGKLLANEIAPRVHNSGHWTIEGAETSQFENHIRAIAGLPLGETGLKRHCIMLNWIGEMPDRGQLMTVPGLHWHDYKKEPRAGRKIGHATLTAETARELERRVELLAPMLDDSRRSALESVL